MATQDAVAIPAVLRKPFSSARSWLIRSTEGDGRTGRIDSSSSRPSALTFSNSKVMTVHRLGEGAEQGRILVVAQERAGRNLRGRTILLGRQHVDAVTEPRGRHCGHAPQLATADDPDRGVGRKRAVHASEGCSATRSVWAARCAARRAARAGSVKARIDPASNAAFTAPARPIASVPDGNAGRHLHDGKQAIHSLQRMALDGDTQDGQDGPGRAHARQMGGAARACDDDGQSPSRCALGIGRQPVGGCGGRRRSAPRTGLPIRPGSRSRGAWWPNPTGCP